MDDYKAAVFSRPIMAVVTACMYETRINTSQTKRGHEMMPLAKGLLATDSNWKGEACFKSVAPDRLTMLHWKATQTKV